MKYIQNLNQAFLPLNFSLWLLNHFSSFKWNLIGPCNFIKINSFAWKLLTMSTICLGKMLKTSDTYKAMRTLFRLLPLNDQLKVFFYLVALCVGSRDEAIFPWLGNVMDPVSIFCLISAWKWSIQATKLYVFMNIAHFYHFFL